MRCCAQYTKVRVNAMYRSMEYLLPPVTVQDIVPPRRKKNEHTPDNLRGKCPMIVPVFFDSHGCNLIGLQNSCSGYKSGYSDVTQPPAFPRGAVFIPARMLMLPQWGGT